jgi:hypothetical protein
MPRLVLIGMVLWVGLAFGADLPTWLLPDPVLTPGVADQSLTAEMLCAKKFTTRDVRSVSEATKREVYERYGVRNHKGRFAKCKRGAEVDHLISLEIGGANVVENLWPEMYCGQWSAVKKDGLENHLHKLVCDGEMDLAEAQQCISTDWIACYKAHMQ